MMVAQQVSKVPQVHGKSDDIMSVLMAWTALLVYGDEKFWMMRYLSDFWGLGIMDKGDD